MSRFVILQHVLTDGQELNLRSPDQSGRSRILGSHWDWMFEHPLGLLTWCTPVLENFLLRPTWVVDACRLPEHRLAYLDFEGPVSGNRGHVIRQWCGTFRYLERPGLEKLRQYFSPETIANASTNRMTFEMSFAGTDRTAMGDFDVEGGSLRFAWLTGVKVEHGGALRLESPGDRQDFDSRC